jgi:hypothetical protein
MFRYEAKVRSAVLATALAALTACSPEPQGDAGEDAAFSALQDRGEVSMGVDQYASTHLFDELPDGGRIEFQYDSDDPQEVEVIRGHLREIEVAFRNGDFSTPAFVHAQEVPGTDVMSERREHIEYRYEDLPRGGELRLTTSDPEALLAIHEFMAFQRGDHRAGGVDHAAMDHATMDHAPTGGMATDQAAPDRPQHQMMPGGQDSAFAADMNLVHELVMNNQAITRTVVDLPNGIRTLTESTDPAVAGLIVAHVASMERRLQAGEVFNLFSPTIPILFENYDRIHSEFESTPNGVAVVQTSEDPALVAALQAHAAEVTELVDEGMMAMMRGMMESGMQGQMHEMMMGHTPGSGAMQGQRGMGMPNGQSP